jgi:hypothetical protein
VTRRSNWPLTIRGARHAYAASTLCAVIIGNRSPNTTMIGLSMPRELLRQHDVIRNLDAVAREVVVPVDAEQVACVRRVLVDA